MIDSLVQVVQLLEDCRIPYMITGSFASNLHGAPRTTYDADIVIEATRSSLDSFLEQLGDGFYVSEDAARQALAGEGMFNIIHLDSGFKIDLIIRKSRAFSREEFQRRVQHKLSGRPGWFASPEDVILAKLEWFQKGASHRQFDDALSVARVQKKRLDVDYLRKWAGAIGVSDLAERLLDEL